MNEVQVKQATRLKAQLLAQTKEKQRDLLLRQAGSPASSRVTRRRENGVTQEAAYALSGFPAFCVL